MAAQHRHYDGRWSGREKIRWLMVIRWWYVWCNKGGKPLISPLQVGYNRATKFKILHIKAITIAKIWFILPSIIEFFTIEFDGDVNGARTSRCSMAIDTWRISRKKSFRYQRIRKIFWQRGKKAEIYILIPEESRYEILFFSFIRRREIKM